MEPLEVTRVYPCYLNTNANEFLAMQFWTCITCNLNKTRWLLIKQMFVSTILETEQSLLACLSG